MDPSRTSSSEAERQVAAAVDRYREAVASSETGGRAEIGQQAAVKAVDRALSLLTFVLGRAVETGVSVARLSELSGWEPERVRAELGPAPEPPLVARAPGSLEASVRLHALVFDILADVDSDAWSPAGEDLDELRDRLETAWRTWRTGLSAPPPD